MTAAPKHTPITMALSGPEREWAELVITAPRLAGTAARYLDQISLSLRPASVIVADGSLRIFCRYLVECHPDVTSFTQVGRPEIEGFKQALAERLTPKQTLVTPNYRRHRLGMVRTFFDRIIEWDWPDAPARCPIFNTDLPKPDEPLPKFLGDGDATR